MGSADLVEAQIKVAGDVEQGVFGLDGVGPRRTNDCLYLPIFLSVGQRIGVGHGLFLGKARLVPGKAGLAHKQEAEPPHHTQQMTFHTHSRDVQCLAAARFFALRRGFFCSARSRSSLRFRFTKLPWRVSTWAASLS